MVIATAKKVLLIDDDELLHERVGEFLHANGFQCGKRTNPRNTLDKLESFQPDIVLLDVTMPEEDGFSVLLKIREASTVPVIMLTAKTEYIDKITGLTLGADDYIPKPFNPRELLARIRAVLRRQANELPGAPSQEEAVIAFGKFKLNLGTREMFREDEPMPLTSGEFAVLKALVSHPREPLSRDKLMNLARGREYSAMERSIDVQISRLRRMVEEDPAHPRYIQTVWGLGYVFVPDGSKA